jgi:hypothetical protein
MLVSRAVSSWSPIAMVAAVLLAVFLSAGYGVIAVCVLVLGAGLLCGAIMSWIAPD